MPPALLEYRTTAADRFSGCVPLTPGGAAFTFGVEEDPGISLSAGAFQLPFPQVSHWTW